MTDPWQAVTERQAYPTDAEKGALFRDLQRLNDECLRLVTELELATKRGAQLLEENRALKAQLEAAHLLLREYRRASRYDKRL